MSPGLWVMSLWFKWRDLWSEQLGRGKKTMACQCLCLHIIYINLHISTYAVSVCMLVAYYAWLCFVYIYITTAVGGWASHAVTRGLCWSQGTRHQRLFPAVLASPHNPGLRQKAPVRPQHTGPAALGPVGPVGPVEPAAIRWFWWIFGTPPQHAVFEFCTIILNTTGQDTSTMGSMCGTP